MTEDRPIEAPAGNALSASDLSASDLSASDPLPEVDAAPTGEPPPDFDALPAGESLPDFDALWNHADPAATESHFRTLLPVFERAAPTSEAARSAYLQLLTQLARTQGLQRRFDAAHRILDTVAPQLGAADDVTRVRYLLERGRTLNASGHPGDARSLFVEAFDLALACGADGFAVDAAHMVAIVEPPDGALAWNERALALAESSADPAAQRWRASLFNNLGWTYHAMGDDARALDLFMRAVPLREATGNAATTRIARWSVARILRSLGRVDEALHKQSALLAELDAAGDADGFVCEELAECLTALGHPEDARPHFARAHALLSADAWFVADEPARLARLAEMAGTTRTSSVE